MRKVIEMQMKIGEVQISKISFDLKSRDEMTQLLIGLKHIYYDHQLRDEIFTVLKDLIPSGINPNNGRRGMDLWKIFVLGNIRLICDWDFDKLKEIADNHRNLRRILFHPDYDESLYPLQTIKDNIELFTPAILDRINQIVVKAGHKALGKKGEVDLKGSCDSFVVETNVHYPTDSNLLFDAIRKIVSIIAAVCSEVGFTGWRQSHHSTSKVKRMLREIQNLRRSTSKDKNKKAEKEKKNIEIHQEYIDLCQSLVDRVKATINLLSDMKVLTIEAGVQILDVEKYIKDAERQIDQISRRVIKGEVIPHEEKVFSIFQRHTEWISKGKAGISQELGLRVCILKDQFGYTLHHQVLEKQTDDKVAVAMVKEAKARFQRLTSCSFDKGFHSPANKKELSGIIDSVILPKKGKLSEQEKEIEHSEEFIQARRKHSAVESAINALENHGLDRCPDHGIDGFKRYVALSVVARNIQILGHTIQQKEIRKQNIREALQHRKAS